MTAIAATFSAFGGGFFKTFAAFFKREKGKTQCANDINIGYGK